MPSKSKGPIKRRHAFHGVIMVCGWLLPPLAVLIRFGVGLDLFINIICTICGYIPGHFHNFWIQNIRNNKNSRHSPSWAIRYGLVKDYRVKRTANGWSDRYGDGAADFRGQDIIVDPITGETRKDTESGRNKGNIRSGSHFFSPWADNVDDSPRAEREDATDPYAEERRRNAGRPGNVVRDPITGAIIDDGGAGGGSLSRTSSRRSLGSRYAERYGIAGTEASSRSSFSYASDTKDNKGGSKWGRSNSSKNKKDRWAREAEALGHASDNYSFDDQTNNGSNNHNSRIRDPLNDRHDF